MAKVSINIIKNWFKNGLKPTQEQFWAWMDSYWHKDEKLPIETVDGLDEIIANKADTEQLTNHVNDNTAHGIPELKKELETGIAEKADTKQLTNHINDNDAHGIPGLKKALETLIATKTDKGGYDGTSKDLKDEIDANKKAFDAYTPPEYNIDLAANQLTLLKDGAKVSELDLSVYLDDTNLARLVSGTLNAETGVLTVTRDDDTTFDIDLSALMDEIPAPAWGEITGSISNQTDLHAEITKRTRRDNAEIIKGSWSFHGDMQVGDSTFSSVKFRNSGLTSYFKGERETGIYFASNEITLASALDAGRALLKLHHLTGFRSFSFPDKGGIIALTNDLSDKINRSGDTMNGTLTTVTGTSSIAPVKIPTGTLTTVPQDGAIERDSAGLHHVVNGKRYQLLDERDTNEFIQVTWKEGGIRSYYNEKLQPQDSEMFLYQKYSGIREDGAYVHELFNYIKMNNGRWSSGVKPIEIRWGFGLSIGNSFLPLFEVLHEGENGEAINTAWSKQVFIKQKNVIKVFTTKVSYGRDGEWYEFYTTGFNYSYTLLDFNGNVLSTTQREAYIELNRFSNGDYHNVNPDEAATIEDVIPNIAMQVSVKYADSTNANSNNLAYNPYLDTFGGFTTKF